jgi:hypothetical protein
MERHSSSRQSGTSAAVQVRAPRVSDAVEGSLAAAYAPAATLPEDMRRCLRRLEGVEIAH